ncbi:phage major capsid protein [Nocardiopsis rhodophaea]|uniref:phage major capsid protein n=1 Tax=Nocardiopsis rhodophaea TaxID=280238 RepID=UPI0031CE79B0
MAQTKTLDELKEELKATVKAASDIADAAEHAGRDMNDTERADAQQHLSKAHELAKQVKARDGDEAVRDSIKELEGVGYAPGGRGRRTPEGKTADLSGKSIGEHFVGSAEFQEMLAQKSGAHFGTQQRIASRPVGYKDLLTGSDPTSAGGFVRPDYRGLQLGLDPFVRPLTMRELVAQATTGSDTVEYTYIDTVSNRAAFVAESRSVETPSDPGPSTGVKPLSGFTTKSTSTGVKTIAHWFAMTRRAISDAAQVRTLVDALLRYGLEDEIDRQIISGDDNGSENLRGIANTEGVQVLNVDPGKGDPVRANIESIRRAKTMTRLGARARANGIVANPLDLEAMDLIKDNEGRYILGGPVATGGTGGLWNLPVVENESVPEGQLWVGDWKKAILYDREEASITVTDSHADFFVRNMVAILAECRVAFAVIQPSAFVKVELAA